MSDNNFNPPQPPTLFSFPNSLLAGTGKLKKSKEKSAFCDYNLALYSGNQSVSLNERMRIIDQFHFHSPTEEECKLLHIPDDRINLLLVKDLLYLCGGGVGVRFTGEELMALKAISSNMSQLWTSIDQQYNALNISQKKVVISDILTTKIATEDDSITGVIKLHEDIDNYLVLVSELQQIVKSKQLSIDAANRSSGTSLICYMVLLFYLFTSISYQNRCYQGKLTQIQRAALVRKSLYGFRV